MDRRSGERSRAGFLAAVAAGVALVCSAVVVGLPPEPAAAAPGDFTVAPTTLNFPSAHVGEVRDIDVVITNVSGATRSPNFSGGAPLDAANFGGSQNCAGKTFAPNDTCTFTYEFQPATIGPHSSTTTIGIDSQNFAITMSGTGLSPFTVSPTSLDFGAVPVGGTGTIQVVITNVSSVSQSPNFSGGAPLDPTNFGGGQNCAGKTFAPGESCQFTYDFEPTTLGPHDTTTTIGIGSENFPITMKGTGGAFTVEPTSVNFGGLAVGKQRSQQVVVTNVSATSQTPAFSGGAPLDATNFGSSQNCAGTTLAPGASCAFTYTFHPTTPGVHDSTTTIGIGTENHAITFHGIGTNGCAATPPAPSPFPDVDATSTHGPAIICLAGLEVVSGLAGGTFGPSQGVTRGQLASFAARLLRVAGVDVPDSGATPFTDIAGSVHAGAIGAMFQLGVIRGTTATTFGPDIPVTREQIASILATSFGVAAGTNLPPGPDAFVDDNGSVHEPNINRVAAAGIAKGTGPGTFDPHGGATRGQVATFLARLLDAILAA